MKKRKFLWRFVFALLAVVLCTGVASAQTGTLTGTVVDGHNEPLIGVSVLVQGTNTGTATDIDGNFKLTNLKKGAKIVFSYVGYETRTITYEGQAQETVELLETNTQLEGVVVVGYGSMQKKQVTSSISSIKGEDLTAGIGGSDIGTALQGKISGLTITGNDSPNNESGFQIRGVGSVNAGNGPLIVIDGVPGGDMRSVMPEDIESIDVLKDASAGAIYGTKAAGGVILITTKKARTDKVRVTYTGEFSTQFIRKKPDILSADEYLDIVPNTTDWGGREDWYDAVTNDHPFSQQHIINLQGATDNFNVYASLMYKDYEGIVIGDNRKDWSGRINANYKFWNGRAEIGLRLTVREAQRDQRGGYSQVRMATIMNPTIPMYDPETGEYNLTGYGLGSDYWNPVADVELKKHDAKDQWLLGTATFRFNIWDGLNFNASASVDRRQWYQHGYTDAKHRDSVRGGYSGYAYHNFSKTNRVSYDAYLNYLKEFGADKEHRVDATAGWSFWEDNGAEGFNASNNDFSVNGIGEWNLGEGSYLKDGDASMSSSKGIRERLISFFARGTYSYDDRYMINASVRHEASSKFGANNRWGTFWGVSGGWRISREAFMRNTTEWLNDLKLRVSYGTTGNSGLPGGQAMTLLTSGNGMPNAATGQWSYTYGPSNNGNPDLKWEVKKEFNVGLDFAFLNERLWGKFDWYTRTTSDLIFSVDAPQPPYVENHIYRNIGSMSGSGWELEIAGIPIQNRNFSWTSSLFLSHSSAKIKHLGMEGQTLNGVGFPSPGNPGDGARLYDGAPIGQFWVYKYAGLTEDGNIMIYDNEGNAIPAAGNLKEEYKQFVGNALPAVILTWNNSLRYRNFDFGIQLRSWIDHDVYNQPSMYNGLIASSGQNLFRHLYERNKDIKGDKVLTDYFIEDASFLKIDNITLGYTLNLGKYTKNWVERLRLYVTLRNVACFTKYSGQQPEVSINGLWPGFEQQDAASTFYPQTINTTFGIQITL